MKQGIFLVEENRPLTETVRYFRFGGDSSAIQKPGEFVQLSLPGRFLRRPFSVSDWGDGWFSLIVDRVGVGTEIMHSLPVGTKLDALTGLGTGFDLSQAQGKSVVLFGGGTGLSPLVGLSRQLPDAIVLLGFRDMVHAFGAEFFPGRKILTTADPITALLEIPHNYFYACGSETMMREICAADSSDGQIAFDKRLGCGFGACMGCSIRTTAGMKRFCKDGHVFRKGELVWDG